MEPELLGLPVIGMSGVTGSTELSQATRLSGVVKVSNCWGLGL